ncbi:MAG: methionyl-tRNA formyltransferase [Acutalibacteraceae bacterium]|jgi:methionyl-tRNA formyltransferase
MRIVFMGTPDYAAKTLEKLISSKHEVVAVFAQPDKPVGRKQVLTPPPVKVLAAEHSIPVYQPASLKTGEHTQILEQIAPDAIVVVAYGKILPEDILSIPKYGCINGHASLLPKYRGASPIQWSIVCGETETGVTTMLMDKGMDTGDILEQTTVKIGEDETAGELFERLSEISADLMLSTLQKLENGTITPKKQDESKATYAPIIKKEMALLVFTKSSAEIFNAVRGFYPWPCAYFFIEGRRIKAIKCRLGDKTSSPAGAVVGNTDYLEVACGDGRTVIFEILQPEGSRQMSAKQMLCGRPVAAGYIIGGQNG